IWAFVTSARLLGLCVDHFFPGTRTSALQAANYPTQAELFSHADHLDYWDKLRPPHSSIPTESKVPGGTEGRCLMARGINKVILVGNLGADPETRYTATGAAITNIRIATSESWRDKQSGEQQERTEWHRVVFFNRLAEIAGEYLR